MRHFTLSLILPVLLFIHLFGYGQTAANNGDKITQVENGLAGSSQLPGQKPGNIKERMAHFHIHGLSIAVIQDHHIIWAKGYGWADTVQFA